MHVRVLLCATAPHACLACNGARLKPRRCSGGRTKGTPTACSIPPLRFKPQARNSRTTCCVRLPGHTVHDLCAVTRERARAFFEERTCSALDEATDLLLTENARRLALRLESASATSRSTASRHALGGEGAAHQPHTALGTSPQYAVRCWTNRPSACTRVTWPRDRADAAPEGCRKFPRGCGARPDRSCCRPTASSHGAPEPLSCGEIVSSARPTS